MPDHPAGSGADLARQALAAYKATAGTRPTTPRKTARIRRNRPGGRDPITLATAISRINAEQGWEVGLHGGSILDQWTVLCPQYDGLIAAEGFDPDRGRLDLRPSTPAYATQLRLLGGQLAKQINDKLGRTVVRSIRVLPIGPITQPRTASVPEQPTTPISLAPVRTRDTASPGYHLALAAHLEHKPDPGPTNPHLRAAIQASDHALADPAHREPETAFTDAIAAAEKLTVGQPDDSLDASLRAARARAARERSGDVQPVRRLFETA
ncbi:DciA family protein [Streptomyces hebeiensis]